jgi:uncharacterized ferritin-like protein (DUF455 family)
MSLEAAALEALMTCDPAHKCRLTQHLHAAWGAGRLPRSGLSAAGRIAVPGRPARPELVRPDALPRRSGHTPQAQAALLHAIAHIEFNAINLAIDCVLRFSAQGDLFVSQWLQVAKEESEHFSLLAARLAALGFAYGDFPAHNGLWEMAVKTDGDFLARMALVPRLLEARGLDATLPIQARLREMRDVESLQILDIILRDEIGHVAIGDHWFRAECAARGLLAEEEYLRLIDFFEAPPPRPPFNVPARLQAGFTEAELAVLASRQRGPLRGEP